MLKIIPWDILFIIINLIVLYVILRLVLIKPIRGIIEQRQQIIDSGLQNAAESEKNAKAIEAEWKEKLDSAGTQSAEMIEKAKLDAKAEYEKLVSEAKGEAERIVSKARKNMDEEREKVVQELQSQAAGIALDTARKVLESSDLSDVNKSLYDKFLTESGDGHGSESN